MNKIKVLSVLRQYEVIGYSRKIHKFEYTYDVAAEYRFICGHFEVPTTREYAWEISTPMGRKLCNVPDFHFMSEEELFQQSLIWDYPIPVEILTAFMKDAYQAYQEKDYSTVSLELPII